MVGSLCELRSGTHGIWNVCQDFLSACFLEFSSVWLKVDAWHPVGPSFGIQHVHRFEHTRSISQRHRVSIFMTKRTSIKFLDTKKRDGLFFPSPPMDLGVRPSGDRTHRGSGSLAGCDVPYKLLSAAMTGARSCCLHSTPDYASNLCASDAVWMASGLAAFSVFPNARRVPEKYPYALIFRSFLLNKSHFSLLI